MSIFTSSYIQVFVLLIFFVCLFVLWKSIERDRERGSFITNSFLTSKKLNLLGCFRVSTLFHSPISSLVFNTHPKMSNGNPNIKSNIFELYSQARALTQMRVAATRCSTSIRTVYALLETVSQNKREVSQQEIERGFTTLGECLQSAEPMSSDSSC